MGLSAHEMNCSRLCILPPIAHIQISLVYHMIRISYPPKCSPSMTRMFFVFCILVQDVFVLCLKIAKSVYRNVEWQDANKYHKYLHRNKQVFDIDINKIAISLGVLIPVPPVITLKASWVGRWRSWNGGDFCRGRSFPSWGKIGKVKMSFIRQYIIYIYNIYTHTYTCIYFVYAFICIIPCVYSILYVDGR